MDGIERQLVRDDDFGVDLEQQYKSRGQGAYKVYLEPYKSGLVGTGERHSKPMLRHQKYIELPAKLSEMRMGAKVASLMGILPEINRVWVTVDNSLFLWDYASPKSEYEEVVKMSQDDNSVAIVSVALSAPRPGIFLDSVKYVLVVATTVHVAILALKSEEQSDSVSLLQTHFVVGTDNILIRKVVGTQAGRVFMVGSDNNLYELIYDNADSTWATLTGAPRFKCQKIKHSGWNWNWRLVDLVPPVLRSNLGAEEFAVDMQVDNVRNVLYTADSSSHLSVFYLGTDGYSSSYSCHSFNLFDHASKFLATGWLSEGSPTSAAFGPSARQKGLQIVSLNVVPLTESRKVHLVVALNNGTRVYLRLMNADGTVYLDTPDDRKKTTPHPNTVNNSLATMKSQSGSSAVPFAPTYGPSRLEVVFIRAPPSAEATAALQAPEPSQEDGYTPTLRTYDQTTYTSSFYCKGVFLCAIDRGSGSGNSSSSRMGSTGGLSHGGGAEDGDELMGLCEDLWARGLGDLNENRTQRPSLRESLSCLPLRGRVHDIKESCAVVKHETACQLLSLTTVSATPLKHSIDNYVGPRTVRYDPRVYPSESPALLGNVLAPGGRVASLGIPRNALEQIPLTNELTIQHMPCRNFALQRQLLVLEGNGMHVLQKLRPVDYLYDAIQTNLGNPERLQRVLLSLSNGYGADQFCAMMLGIACGLPSDAGGNPDMDVTCTVGLNVHYDSEVRAAALRYLRLPPSSVPRARPNQIPNPVGMEASALSEADVHTSCVYNGLEMLLSRLLRPVWLREVIDEDPMFKRCHPAQWMSPDLLSSIMVPLQELKQTLLQPFMFESIIRSNHRFTTYAHNSTDQANMTSNIQGAAGTSGGVGGINSGTGTSGSSYNLSNTYSAGGSTSGGTGGSHVGGSGASFLSHTGNLTYDELRHRLARDFENECTCKLYRLLARTIQALQLLRLLLKADLDWRLPVRWADFRSLSVRKMVTSMRAHDKIKTCLRKLIFESSRNNRHKAADARSLTTNLTNALKDDCYMFYSEGDEKWHEAEEGLAALEHSIENALSSVSPEVRRQAKNTIGLLVDAAGHWYDPDLVVPYGSEKTELEQKCEQLLRLGEIGRQGVPELCMSAVRNFSAWSPSYQYLRGNSSNDASANSSGASALSSGAHISGHEVDDKGLYHGGNILTPAEMDKARVSVYNTLLATIMSLGADNASTLGGGDGALLSRGERLSPGEVERSMLEMLLHSIRLCTNDSLFHQLLCEKLYRAHKEVLLQVNEPFVETFLTQNDGDLLYRWQGRHGYHERATELMYSRAMTVNSSNNSDAPMTIHQRVECLRYALRSANATGSGNKFNYSELLRLGEAWVGVYESFSSLLTGIKELRSNAGSDDEAEKFGGVVASLEDITDRCLLTFVSDEGLESSSQGGGAQAAQHYRASQAEVDWLFKKCEMFQLWEEMLTLSFAAPTLSLSEQRVAVIWRSILYRYVSAYVISFSSPSILPSLSILCIAGLTRRRRDH
jgi:uncharacterized membrane protein YgcG